MCQNHQTFISCSLVHNFHMCNNNNRNFRPITRAGRSLHTAKEKVNRLPALVDNPHVMLLNFLVAKT